MLPRAPDARLALINTRRWELKAEHMSTCEFEDENVALAVLQSMISSGVVPEPDWEAVQRANPYDRDLYWDDVFDYWDEVSGESEEEKERIFQEACAYRYLNTGVVHDLVGYLDQYAAELPQLTTLRWWVPCDVMWACWPQWDGESDEFYFTSLNGIEQCSTLTSISVQHIIAPVDLSPLTRLPLLAEIEIGHAPKIEDWSPLLAIPALRSVTAPVGEAVARRLLDRGVQWRAPR
jgi:hypothetical protein